MEQQVYNNMSYSTTPTNQINIEMKQLEQDHHNLKIKIASMYDELISLEKKYEIAVNELKKRGVQ